MVGTTGRSSVQTAERSNRADTAKPPAGQLLSLLPSFFRGSTILLRSRGMPSVVRGSTILLRYRGVSELSCSPPLLEHLFHVENAVAVLTRAGVELNQRAHRRESVLVPGAQY